MLPPALGDLRTCVSPFLGQSAPRNVSKSDWRILYYNALAWSMGLGIMQFCPLGAAGLRANFPIIDNFGILPRFK